MPERVGTAIDLGAGTGKFTQLLLGRADRVIAVEPSEAMLDVLRANLPAVEAHTGGAEDIPLQDATADVVSVAQAFHWFDREPACAEIQRVLVPGGVLGLLWNHSDPDCSWDHACHRVAHPAVADADSTTDSAAEELSGFTFHERQRLSWSEQITRDDYIGRWLTVSSFLVADEAARTQMTAQIEVILDTDPQTCGRTEFELPMLTDVFVYRAAA